MPEKKWEVGGLKLEVLLWWNAMASSKNNANIVPISGGSVGCGGYFT
jgi:hypothetical protein